MYFFEKFLLYPKAKTRQTEQTAAMTEERCNGLVSPYNEKKNLIFESSSLLVGMDKQTECIIMMTKEGFTKMVNSMTHKQGLICHNPPYYLYGENALS